MSISMEQMEEVLESFNDHNVERIVSNFLKKKVSS